MMNLNKKALALAVAAAAMGMGVSQVQAQAVARHSMGQAVARNSMGQALIYPYMTANNGWQTFLHVTNTSNSTVAAKVRFRTAKDSLDAYDFILVLSPSDMWTGVVEEQNGHYGIRSTDASCTVPVMGVNAFERFNIDDVSEVYAEVIMMGVSNATATGSVASNAKHSSAGVPKDCYAVQTSFQSQANVAALTEFDPAVNAASNLNVVGDTNFLTGKFDLVNVGHGWSGAGRATVISDFGAPVTPLGVGVTGPVFNNTNMWWHNAPGWEHPTLAEGKAGLTGINTILTKSNLINEWVLNPNLGELSSWIVTFPTKKLTVDAITAQNSLALQTVKLSPFGGTTVDGMDCVGITPNIFNREELPLVTGSGKTPALCYEANVINFKSGSVDSSSVLDSSVATTLTTTSTGILAGWMNLAMPNNSILYGFDVAGPETNSWTTLPGWTPAILVATGGVAPNGRPAVGFNVTARTTPSDTVLYDHAYLP